MRCTKAILVAAVLVPAAAHADDLQVTTQEYPAWPVAVAALQADQHSEGRTLHVIVQDGSQRVMCNAYSLGLDSVARDAFVVPGECNPETGATEIRLVHRAALFDHSDAVPRPLAVGISATQIRTGVTAGGAANEGGSEVQCSVAVHPYIQDLEHGVRVFLNPGRYVLRPRAMQVTAVAQGDGWILRTSDHAELTIEYDVYDSQHDQVVLHDRATLACGDEHFGPTVGTVTGEVPATMYAHEGIVISPAQADPRSPPDRPGYTWMFQWGLLGGGIAAFNSLPLYGGANGARLGANLPSPVGTQAGISGLAGDFGLSVDANWIYAAIETGWYGFSGVWEANVRATLAPSVRVGPLMLFAGPTAIGSYITGQDYYGRWYDTGIMLNAAITAGLRVRFENWNAAERHFSVQEISLESVIPITGSEGFVLFGIGFGRGY